MTLPDMTPDRQRAASTEEHLGLLTADSWSRRDSVSCLILSMASLAKLLKLCKQRKPAQLITLRNYLTLPAQGISKVNTTSSVSSHVAPVRFLEALSCDGIQGTR